MNFRKLIAEEIRVHVRRADKEPVTVHRVDAKTGESKVKAVNRSRGEIKIHETAEHPKWVHRFMSTQSVPSWVRKQYDRGRPVAHLLHGPQRLLDAENHDPDMETENGRSSAFAYGSAKMSDMTRTDLNGDMIDVHWEDGFATEGALKVGNLLLGDGTHARLSRDDVDALSALLNTLTDENKHKMDEKIHASKSELAKILAFAREVKNGLQ